MSNYYLFPPSCSVCKRTIQNVQPACLVNGKPTHLKCKAGGTPYKSQTSSTLGPKTGPHSLSSKLAYDSLATRGNITPLQPLSKNAIEHDWSTPLIAPRLLHYYPFQEEGIHSILSRRNTLLADEMGIGKSIQAIGFLNNSPEIRSVLLVCPASLRYNWAQELRTWLVTEGSSPYRVVGFFPEADLTEIDIAICSYNQLASKMHLYPNAKFDAFILDEAHFAKNPDAKRTKAVRAAANRSKRLLFLTGSPIENRTEELYSLLQMLDPDTWDPPLLFNGQRIPESAEAGFHRFAIRYCGAESKYIYQVVGRDNEGKPVKKKKRFFDFRGATNLEELHVKLKQSCMIRRLKKDVLSQLPPKIRQLIVLPPIAKDAIEEEHKQFIATGLDYESSIENLQKALLLFPELAKARHATALAKVPLVIEHIERLLENDAIPKVVVFAHHKDVLAQIADACDKYQSVSYHGEMTEAMKNRSVNLFQTNPDTRVFVGSLTAAGVGLTLTAASHMVFAEIDWKDLRQCEDRIHRIGQREDVCIYQTIVFDQSIDANMAKKIMEKMRISERVLDGEVD